MPQRPAQRGAAPLATARSTAGGSAQTGQAHANRRPGKEAGLQPGAQEISPTFVPRPTHTMSSPVAMGSSVPAAGQRGSAPAVTACQTGHAACTACAGHRVHRPAIRASLAPASQRCPEPLCSPACPTFTSRFFLRSSAASAPRSLPHTSNEVQPWGLSMSRTAFSQAAGSAGTVGGGTAVGITTCFTFFACCTCCCCCWWLGGAAVCCGAGLTAAAAASSAAAEVVRRCRLGAGSAIRASNTCGRRQ